MSATLARLPNADQRRLEDAGERPRTLLLEDQLSADVLDAAYFAGLSRPLRLFYRRLPGWLAQTLEALRVRRRYDVVVTWDDRVALLYAFLLGMIRSRSRHVAIVSWMGPVKKGSMLRRVQKRIDRIVVWTRFHRDLLAELYSIAPQRFALAPYWVDDQFFAPRKAGQDMICAVGDSKRDYGTLVGALSGLPLPCRIVTQAAMRDLAGDWGVTGQALESASSSLANIKIGAATASELRDVYARSRFVVVPLFPSLRDHGITSVFEAMAMGKAVICTQTDGLTGMIEDGVTGILVPPGDPDALRAAIKRLWDEPDLAQRLGAAGRKRVEAHNRLDLFVAAVRQAVSEVVTGGGRASPVEEAATLKGTPQASATNHRLVGAQAPTQ
jgi:glycosyltransferase involved in cell wall biosynthesis